MAARALALGCLLLAVYLGTAEARGLRLCGKRLTKILVKICRGKLCGGFANQAVKRPAITPSDALLAAVTNETIQRPPFSANGEISTENHHQYPPQRHISRSSAKQAKGSGDHLSVEEKLVGFGRAGANTHEVVFGRVWAKDGVDDDDEDDHFEAEEAHEVYGDGRVKRGVADQCCKNRCSFSYLKSFCC